MDAEGVREYSLFCLFPVPSPAVRTMKAKRGGLVLQQELYGGRVELSSLFNIPDGYSLSDGTKRYYGSMTPVLAEITSMNHVDFEVSYTEPKECLPHDNPINTHLFKPKYTNSGARCYVPNTEVLAHTLRSLAVLAHHVGNSRVTVSVHNLGHRYLDHSKNWKIADRVLLCWKDSFLKFLKIHWLLSSGVDTHQVHRLVCELENRLSVPNPAVLAEIDFACQANGISLGSFEDAFAIQHQNSSVPWITSANLRIGSTPITIVQFPWGISLAREMLSTLLSLHPKIKRVGLVGGIGYLRDDDMELDDPFLATEVLRSEAQTLKNLIFEVPENTYFKKRASTGLIKTVVPTIGVLSNTAALKNQRTNICAIDMEFEGIVDAVGLKEFGAAHYIMDLPLRGLSLGDTYYHRPYLEKFFRTFNRGKYYCFERLLTFMQA